MMLTMMHWQTTRYRIDLTRPRVMGIVNVTPDSFSDGGRLGLDAIRHCERLLLVMRHIERGCADPLQHFTQL